MELQLGIIVLGVIEAISFVAILAAGVALVATGRDAMQRAQPVVRRGRRLKELGMRIYHSARAKSEQIAAIGHEVAEHVAQRWRTTRRLVEEVRHPEAAPVADLTQQIERGRRFTERLIRLREAAQKAAGRNGSRRTPA